MSKVAKKASRKSKVSKSALKRSKSAIKKHNRPVKSRALRKLQKSRPKKYLNAFLCFAQEVRRKAKGGHLVSEWKAAHKGLGGKWSALGAAEKAKFKRQGKISAFAVFIMLPH